jgi:hypothetical protein
VLRSIVLIAQFEARRSRGEGRARTTVAQCEDRSNVGSLVVLLRLLYHRSDTDRDGFGSRSPRLSATITHEPTFAPLFDLVTGLGETLGAQDRRRLRHKQDLSNPQRSMQSSLTYDKHEDIKARSIESFHHLTAVNNDEGDKQSIPLRTRTLHGSKETPFEFRLVLASGGTPAAASPLVLQLGVASTSTHRLRCHPLPRYLERTKRSSNARLSPNEVGSSAQAPGHDRQRRHIHSYNCKNHTLQCLCLTHLW